MTQLLTDTMLRALRRNIQQGSQREQLQAIQLLSSDASDEKAVDLLIEALDVDDLEVKARVITVLTRQNALKAVPRLTTMLTNPDPELRRQAVQALGKMRSEDALLSIAQLLDDEVVAVRLEALEAISWQNEPWISGVIASLLYDPEPRVRRRTCEAFANGLAPLPVEDLFITLSDPDEWVRFWSIEALRTAADDHRAVQGVINRLYDSAPNVQERAAKTLGYMVAERALPHFEYLINSDDVPETLLAKIDEALEYFDDEYARNLHRAVEVVLKESQS